MISKPSLLVVCGVSGSGKSTVARELARRRKQRFLEADDYHSAEARERMAQELPLDDELRRPWIAAIRTHLQRIADAGEDCILAYSGLKRKYREALRDTGFTTTFFMLSADRELIRQRLEHRQGHFMPASLLDSQLEILEPPADEPDTHRVDASKDLANTMRQIDSILADKPL